MKTLVSAFALCLGSMIALGQTTINTFDEALHTGANTITETFTFPSDVSGFSEVTMDFALTCPTGGCDPWDRVAWLQLVHEGKTYEIGRYVTPYGNGNCSWTLDVTEYKHMLTGDVELKSYIETWSNGWEITVDFTFTDGTPTYAYTDVDNLWVDYNKVYGDPVVSTNELEELEGYIPANAEKVVLRIVNTGHGQGNYENAAEFSNKTHEISVNGNVVATQNLWKADCNQNPCGPQAGTWTASRAGWCPGQEVQPDDYDITQYVTPGENVRVDYILEDYYNLCGPWVPNCDVSNCMSWVNDCTYDGSGHTAPNYKISAQLITYSSSPLYGGPFWPTGINDPLVHQQGLKISPNPSAGDVTIEADAELFRGGELLITDLTGKVVWASSYDFRHRNIDHINLVGNPPGLYLVTLISDKGQRTGKLMLTE